MSNFVKGMIAGAAGATALDFVTYFDMAVRGRPPSKVPGETARRLSHAIGMTALDGDGKAANRRNAAGFIAGHTDGVMAGGVYGLVRALVPRMPWMLGAAGLAAGTLLVGEGTATRVGATDWSTWSATEWLSDLIPRAAFGVVTATAFEMLDR
jgi:hypothetical protein